MGNELYGNSAGYNNEGYNNEGYNSQDYTGGDSFYNSQELLDIEMLEDDVSLYEDTSEEHLSVGDAFVKCMNIIGHVDFDYMNYVSGVSFEAIEEALNGNAICANPEKYEEDGDYYGCFETVSQYIRGNLIKKYKRAKEINDKYGRFDKTMELLENALPDNVDIEDIHMGLGASWIPIGYINRFIKELFEMPLPPSVEYDSYLGKKTITCYSRPNEVLNKITYGTSKMHAIDIIKHILNGRTVKVYDLVERTDGREGKESILNQEATLTAQLKEKEIKAAWDKYVHSDSRIEHKLQEVYMESFGYVVSRYDGSFLELPGLNPDVIPYAHQKNAIARILFNQNVLLAHDVGSGKTIEYMAGVHELIRLKLGKKALIVVPNNTLDAVVNTYRELYPEDLIFAVYPRKEFSSASREKTMAKIASPDYQVIIMAYSSFDMLSLSFHYLKQKKEDEIRECSVHLNNAKTSVARASLKAEHKKLRKALEKFEENYDYKPTDCFDSLGIDILVVDEAHNYKNITLDTKTDDIVGLHAKGSKRADLMLEKVEYIQSINGRVIFATGTPLTNSMADLYVLQRYLQPGEMKLCNIFHFNDWVNTFCSQAHSFEVDVDGKNFRFVTRFSKFHNLPEIMSLFSDVCDFYQIKDGELGLPMFDGYEDVLVGKSIEQKQYIDELSERTERIRNHEVSRKIDNLLKITIDGRNCAVDVRLVYPNVKPEEKTNKVMTCATKITELYHKYPGTTQIAFSDVSTPKSSFNVYDALKSELILRGIPEEEIAFIHDAETEASRNRLEKKFNEGKIRVLIGSTVKLGTGCNVQEKLLAVHHIDVPWRPSDMVQREGRIIRQGNTNPKVFIFRYVTEASFDSFSWQILENKQRFIAQFLSGSLSDVHRDESDCAESILDYAEIKALAIGNELIKKRVELSNELERAKINRKQKDKELNRLKEILESLPKRIFDRKIYIYNAQGDNAFYKINKKSMANDDREEFGRRLLRELAHNVMNDMDTYFETYQGFNVLLPKFMTQEKPYVILARRDGNSYEVKMDGDKALGCCKRLDYALEHLEEVIKDQQNILTDLENQKEEARSKIYAGNPFIDEVERLAKEIDKVDKELKEGE